MKLVLFMCLLCLMVGCSALDVAKGVGGLIGPSSSGDDKSINVESEMVAGDKEEHTEVGVQLGRSNTTTTNNNQKAEAISNNTVNETINEYSVQWWMILLLVLGWMLPSPSAIWRGVMNWRKV